MLLTLSDDTPPNVRVLHVLHLQRAHVYYDQVMHEAELVYRQMSQNFL